jgi:hypothetical protein
MRRGVPRGVQTEPYRKRYALRSRRLLGFKVTQFHSFVSSPDTGQGHRSNRTGTRAAPRGSDRTSTRSMSARTSDPVRRGRRVSDRTLTRTGAATGGGRSRTTQAAPGHARGVGVVRGAAGNPNKSNEAQPQVRLSVSSNYATQTVYSPPNVTTLYAVPRPC